MTSAVTSAEPLVRSPAQVVERRPDDDRVCYPDDPEYDAAHANDVPERHWSP